MAIGTSHLKTGERICISGAAACLAAGIVILYGLLVEPGRVEVTHVNVKNERLAALLDNMTVVHISDLHIGKLRQRELNVLAILRDLRPDVIFLTGDYITWRGDTAGALEFLSKLEAPVGVWAVMGDYDYSRSRESCSFCHRDGSGAISDRHKVKFLRDTVHVVDLQGGQLRIAGLDGEGGGRILDPGRSAAVILERADILLSHDPLIFDHLPDDVGTLVLAGDTHGGQVLLPAWGFQVLGYEKNARYNQGMFEKGRNRMYVNRGIGTSHLPLRLFRKPEITVLHFIR